MIVPNHVTETLLRKKNKLLNISVVPKKKRNVRRSPPLTEGSFTLTSAKRAISKYFSKYYDMEINCMDFTF